MRVLPKGPWSPPPPQDRGQSSDTPGDLNAGEVGLDLAPPGQGAVLGQVLHANTVGNESAVFPHLGVDITVPLGESPLLGDVDLLAAGELELGPTQGLNHLRLIRSEERTESRI